MFRIGQNIPSQMTKVGHINLWYMKTTKNNNNKTMDTWKHTWRRDNIFLWLKQNVNDPNKLIRQCFKETSQWLGHKTIHMDHHPPFYNGILEKRQSPEFPPVNTWPAEVGRQHRQVGNTILGNVSEKRLEKLPTSSPGPPLGGLGERK